MASRTALPIARLRALGCRVGTVIGHSPSIGDWVYGVTLPKGIDTQLAAEATAASTAWGLATASKARADDRLIVSACLYRVGKPMPSKAQREQAERDTAALLSALADVLNGR